MRVWNNFLTFAIEKCKHVKRKFNTMLAQVKHENGKYLVQVYRKHEFLCRKTWQTIAEFEDQSEAIELKEYCSYGNHGKKIALMRFNYLATKK